ncbi:hypothetical protein [Flocculibacter collagenilyticus]|uniref:hypothetical protein n=1 Tax=Flocculibacter collagenilyticus TaxID=2744479 RepID=UPI0018F7BF45|nr:hypothetical protein [Flocculibacter collagenilyticus]
MNVLIGLCGIIACIYGLGLFNNQGAFRPNVKSACIGTALNIVSLVCLIQVYGGARGTFVYLAVASFLGMMFTFSGAKKD